MAITHLKDLRIPFGTVMTNVKTEQTGIVVDGAFHYTNANLYPNSETPYIYLMCATDDEEFNYTLATWALEDCRLVENVNEILLPLLYKDENGDDGEEMMEK